MVLVFILGINFPDRQLVTKALTSLYGIGKTSSAYVAARAPRFPIPNSTPTSSSGVLSTPYKPSQARYSLLARLLARHHIHPTARLSDLADAQVTALARSLSDLTIENELKRKIVQNIERLRDLGTYRGRRHAMNLPVRGQRTRSQIRTARKLNRIDRRV